MSRPTLALKSKSKISQPIPAPDVASVKAGRSPKQSQSSTSAALLNRLEELISAKQQAFIQMRHGAGYRGAPISLEDGWLTLSQATIHGTKHVVCVDTVLIQIRDGSLIAHVHAVQQPTGVSK